MSTIKDDRLIKGLTSQLQKLTGESEALKNELSNKNKEYQSKLQAIKNLKSEIDKLSKDTTVKVSEHAIVRYFERVKGYNIAEIEKDILSDEVLNLISQLGENGKFPNNGFHVVLKNNTVTTIL